MTLGLGPMHAANEQAINNRKVRAIDFVMPPENRIERRALRTGPLKASAIRIRMRRRFKTGPTVALSIDQLRMQTLQFHPHAWPPLRAEVEAA